MLDSIYQHIKMNYKSHFWWENVKILSSFTQQYNGCHNVTLRNLETSSGSLILLHGLISLPDMTSCDMN